LESPPALEQSQPPEKAKELPESHPPPEQPHPPEKAKQPLEASMPPKQPETPQEVKHLPETHQAKQLPASPAPPVHPQPPKKAEQPPAEQPQAPKKAKQQPDSPAPPVHPQPPKKAEQPPESATPPERPQAPKEAKQQPHSPTPPGRPQPPNAAKELPESHPPPEKPPSLKKAEQPPESPSPPVHPHPPKTAKQQPESPAPPQHPQSPKKATQPPEPATPPAQQQPTKKAKQEKQSPATREQPQTPHADCFVMNVKYPVQLQPAMRYVEATPENCRAKCAATKGCEFFSWWSDHGCHLMSADSAGKPEVELGAISGPKQCSDPCGVLPAMKSVPLDMMDEERHEAKSHHECRRLCAATEGCEHWTFWADMGCHLASGVATPKPQSDAITGPVNCRQESEHAEECYTLNGAYGPYLPDRLEVDTPEECLQSCRSASWCAAYTWLDDNTCYFVGVGESTLKVTKGTRSFAGRKLCKVCANPNTKWEPPMPDQKRTEENSQEKCQARCKKLEGAGCAHWTYCQDGGCILAGAKAKMVEEGGAISGPPGCV